VPDEPEVPLLPEVPLVPDEPDVPFAKPGYIHISAIP